MTFDEYIQQAKRTCPDGLDIDKVVMCGLGLSGESGEVTDLIKKWKFHGHELDLDKVQKELGDVMWYIAILVDTLGLNFETVLLKNVKKLKERYPDGFSSEKSINRSE